MAPHFPASYSPGRLSLVLARNCVAWHADKTRPHSLNNGQGHNATPNDDGQPNIHQPAQAGESTAPVAATHRQRQVTLDAGLAVPVGVVALGNGFRAERVWFQSHILPAARTCGSPND